MEIASTIEPVLCHYKGSELVAITHSNGKHEMLKVGEMTKKDIEEFYEVNQLKQPL
jgi:hypothetical protein